MFTHLFGDVVECNDVVHGLQGEVDVFLPSLQVLRLLIDGQDGGLQLLQPIFERAQNLDHALGQRGGRLDMRILNNIRFYFKPDMRVINDPLGQIQSQLNVVLF